MPLITWKDSYSVGNANIDGQHRRLMDLVNELHEAMRTGQANSVLGAILDQLVTYTHTHFAFEERVMAVSGYPGLAEHKKQHAELAERVAGLVAEWKTGRIALSMHVSNFLRQWLDSHILGSDKKYMPWCAAKTAASGAVRTAQPV